MFNMDGREFIKLMCGLPKPSAAAAAAAGMYVCFMIFPNCLICISTAAYTADCRDELICVGPISVTGQVDILTNPK